MPKQFLILGTPGQCQLLASRLVGRADTSGVHVLRRNGSQKRFVVVFASTMPNEPFDGVVVLDDSAKVDHYNIHVFEDYAGMMQWFDRKLYD